MNRRKIGGKAIDDMYTHWKQEGGISPSAEDEMHAVAESLKVSYKLVTPWHNETLAKHMQKAFDVACDGGSTEEIAGHHIDGLVEAGLLT